jgi:hypothetical protein
MGIFPKIFWAFIGFLEMKMNGIRVNLDLEIIPK